MRVRTTKQTLVKATTSTENLKTKDKAEKKNLSVKGDRSKQADKKKQWKHLEKTEEKDPLLINQSIDSKWFNHQYNEKSEKNDEKSNDKLSDFVDEAKILLNEEIMSYNKSYDRRKGSEAAWLRTVSVSGTHTDRITALNLRVEQSPMHSLEDLNSLVAIVQKRGPRDALSVLELLKNLFTNVLLPPNRKLVAFNARPLNQLKKLAGGNAMERKRRLIFWFFEDQLKEAYGNFVQAIEKLMSQSVDTVIMQTAGTVMDLLAERPEQEQILLSMLINKLGHPNYKVASRICRLLIQLSRKQPNMRPVVVGEVERLIFRQNMSERGQFYALCFLCQLHLRPGEGTLAVSLLNIYFALFRTLAAKSRLDSRMLTTLVTGTNRAFPYAKGNNINQQQLLNEIDTLYKVAAQSQFPVALQTLKLLYQVLDASDGVSDRFYTALYRRLLDAHGSQLDNQLFSLLYTALHTDTNENRVRAFIKRILQMALSHSSAFAATALLLVSKLTTERSNLLQLTKQPNKIATIKREIGEEDDDEDEHFADVKEPDTETMKFQPEGKEDPQKTSVEAKIHKRNGWVHRNHTVVRAAPSQYSSDVRNPAFSGAELTVDVELLQLAQHFHPTVAVFADNLIKGVKLRYGGDPLVDFTLMRFLDRFVYRNPKNKKPSSEKESKPGLFRRKVYDPLGVKKLAISSKEYVNKKEDEIPLDERYLHRHANWQLRNRTVDKASSSSSSSKAKHKDEVDWDEIGSVNSDEFDVLIDKFEPGATNDDFEIDFSKEFSTERVKKRGERTTKRKSSSSPDAMEDAQEDEDDVDEDLEEDVDVEDEEEGEEDDEDEDEEDDDDDDEPIGRTQSKRHRRNSFDEFEEDEEEEMTDRLGLAGDAALSADRFAQMLEEEEVGDDERVRQGKKKSNKKTHRKTTKNSRGFKKRKRK